MHCPGYETMTSLEAYSGTSLITPPCIPPKVNHNPEIYVNYLLGLHSSTSMAIFPKCICVCLLLLVLEISIYGIIIYLYLHDLLLLFNLMLGFFNCAICRCN